MERYELDAIIDKLSEVRGGGTWHISVYIRPDKSLQSMANRIGQEISEAESIKSDDTRDRVQSSLQKIRDVLSEYKQTPDNGIVVFASPEDVHVLDDLPFECPENRYHCGKEFITDPLQSEFDTGGTYGLIVVERGRATIGVLHNGRIESVIEKQSQVMGKTRAGGQSAQRFARIREKQKQQFFKDVQETAYATFKGYDTDGVLIGGTISSAKEFASDYTNHEWHVLGTYSVDHGDEQGLGELVERGKDEIFNEEESDMRETVGQFFEAVRDDMAAYGEDAVDDAIDNGRADTVLLSQNLDIDEIRAYNERAEQFGTDVVIVPITFEQAEMYEQMTDGYGAILRW